nr:PREDICTED: protein MMS22-like [Tribolium castaneum]|eukprot:XP_015834017.1 PREDICTED: protein MMS22-like [Tribolium castaneum]
MFYNIFDCCTETPKNPLELFHTYTDSQNYVNAENSETEINGHILCIAIEQVEIITRKIKTNWHYLQSVVLNETTIASDDLIKLREEINKCLKLIIECLKLCESDILKERYVTSSWLHIKKIAQLTLPISELERDIYLKLVSPSNRDRCPVFQYFHTFLDVQFYLLMFDYVCGNSEELQDRINIVVNDLVTLSASGHKQKSNSAFVCNCTKNLWLIIQKLCEKHLEGSFWPIFNKSVENLNGDCILWLLKEVATLQASNNFKQPNFTLLEPSLKKVLSGADFNTSILPILKSLEPLLCDLWLKSSKIEIYQALWDHFSKRLNISFRGSTDFTLTQLVDLIDTILWSGKDCEYDFELYLAMLTTHLSEHPYHWGKMKGRIYSQLGPNKLKDLQKTGIFNVLLLYLALTKVNFEELSKKFLSFIENLPAEKRQTQLIWSFYAAFMVRHVRENRDIETITQPFIKMSEEASTDQKFSHLLKTFVSDFDNIITISANLQLHQWLLINTWIHQYMTTCYYPDLLTLLTTLLKIIDRISTELMWCEWESAFKNNVYPTLKYVAGSRSAPETCGTLAAKIATLTPTLQSEAFTFFNAENIAPKVSANFLCTILENYPTCCLTPAQEIVALQTWVKFCLLTRDGYEELTNQIVKLGVIPPFIKNAIIKVKDPLCAFIEYIGSNIKEYAQSVTMSKLCENFFGQTERWIGQFLAQPDNEATVLRIFTCIGLAFYKLGPLLYNKHKSSCPYARLVSAVLLPTELLIGKPIHAFVLQSVKKTWHLFFEATVKLNSNDAFLDRILRDMVVKYVPHFAIADSPMLKCLDNETNVEIILEKLSNAFFKQPTKEAESTISKSLKLVNDFVQSTTSEKSLKLVVDKTLYGLLEVVMFHNRRNMALDAIKSITCSSLYAKVKAEFEDIVVAVTEKHLAFNSPNYFQLMGHLARIAPETVKNITPRVKQHLANVERMRGVGYDKNLRLNLERLEASLLHKS